MTQPLTQLAIAAARAGGAAIQEAARHPLEVMSKGFRDVVTDADFAAQQAIIATIHAANPDQPVVSEENDVASHLANGQPPSGHWWLVDPLDGTTNFSRAIPQYCTSVAVLEGETVLAGVIYDPQREHLFVAERGGGVTLNGEPVRVTMRDTLGEAIVEAGLARKQASRIEALKVLHALALRCRSVRGLGSAALSMAYVAAGWMDAYFHISLNSWDIAAGALMIREAGGALSGIDGTPWRPDIRAKGRPLLASNGLLHPELLALAQQALGVDGQGAEIPGAGLDDDVIGDANGR